MICHSFLHFHWCTVIHKTNDSFLHTCLPFRTTRMSDLLYNCAKNLFQPTIFSPQKPQLGDKSPVLFSLVICCSISVIFYIANRKKIIKYPFLYEWNHSAYYPLTPSMWKKYIIKLAVYFDFYIHQNFLILSSILIQWGCF